MNQELAVLNREVETLKSMVLSQKANRLNDSLFSPELAPHYQQLAMQLSKSSMVPKSYQGKPQDLFVAMALGYQVGLSVEQAVQCIAVINGRPSMWGDDMLALCTSHPDFEDIIEEPIYDGEMITAYECTVKRKGRTPTIRPFSLADAKKARLLGKAGPWQDYTSRMLQLRARSFALRDAFPDALKGIKSREETQDYIEAEFSQVDESALSRTEMLKQDYINKRGERDEITVDDRVTDKVEHVEIKTTGEERSEVIVREELQQVVEAPIEDMQHEDSPATPEQVATIKRMIEEQGYSPERIIKALFYYEVGKIDLLSYSQAEHFIKLLNK